MKVVKFGGSSVSSFRQIQKVIEIAEADDERKFIVVSAPGKRAAGDRKVTDLLIELGDELLHGLEAETTRKAVLDRYREIAEEAQLGDALLKELEADLDRAIAELRDRPARLRDALKAKGEDYSARLIAACFRAHGLEARYLSPGEAGIVVTDAPGNAAVLPESYDRLHRLREEPGRLVIPGFYGLSKEGEVVTFSRGGSDVTGAIVANGVRADEYENFTDVSGVYNANPNWVPEARIIEEITYREMMELSYAGFTVFHDEALAPLRTGSIPVRVRNTNAPFDPGTKIVHYRVPKEGVTGIACDSGFSSISVRKYLLNKEVGFGRRLLSIFESEGVSFEHMPSGIDSLSVVVRSRYLEGGALSRILHAIKDELAPDELKVEHNLSIVMVVGEGMFYQVGLAHRATRAFMEAGINLKMFSQGASEINMTWIVEQKDEKRAVQSLYRVFFPM